MAHELIVRRDCAEATLAQYIDQPFAWGKADCVRMVAAHVRRMGHRVSLIKAGSYSNAIGAVRALKRAGFNSLEQALDERFARIAPAMAWTGDIVALPGIDGLAALAVQLDHGVILHTLNGGFAVSRPVEFVAAWRVPCLKAG